jgi:hypothetical protein
MKLIKQTACLSIITTLVIILPDKSVSHILAYQQSIKNVKGTQIKKNY